MIRILVDHNIDRILIEKTDKNARISSIEFKAKDLKYMSHFQNLILEIVNIVEPQQYVSLIERNEDRETTIEEW